MLIYLNIIYKIKINTYTYIIIFLILFEIIYVFIAIKDYIKKENINKNLLYLILSIIVLVITNFIYIRLLYDKNFIYNDAISYGKIISYAKQNPYYYNKEIFINVVYLEQNVIYLISLFIPLIIYRKINLKEIDKN